MTQELLNKIINIVGVECVKESEPMKSHTTFRVGGEADLFISISNEEKAASLIRLLSIEKMPFYIIGNGSNLLVSDKGFRGVVVEIGSGMSNISIQGDEVTASAGALLVKVANEAYKNSLTGLEFASGIPGTIGGAIVMNAGAYGGEIKDIVKSVKLLNIETGKIEEKTPSEMLFSYRHSIVKEKPYVVLEATFKLSKGDSEAIKARMDELKEMRVSKQPLEYPSAGSTFKRPEGYFAGKLIQDSGLKGYAVGGAEVSTKHSGFVINKGNATAEDIYTLIEDVKDRVYKDSGVMLEPEVIMLGDFK